MVESVEFQALIVACEILRNLFQEGHLALTGNAANLTRFVRAEPAPGEEVAGGQVEEPDPE